MTQSKHRVFSFSAIKDFEQCPKKYYDTRVLKLYPFEQSEEAKWGDYVHKCFEEHLMRGVPLPDNVSQYQPLMDAVHQRRAAGWRAVCELGFGVGMVNPHQAKLSSQPDIWWDKALDIAGYIDLLMLSPDRTQAVIVDWKTNKSSKYADVKQLELYAYGILRAIPTVQRVEGSLIFLNDNFKMAKTTVERSDMQRLQFYWFQKHAAINSAFAIEPELGFKPGEYTPLCGWCPCSDCDNWQQGQDFRAKRDKKGRS